MCLDIFIDKKALRYEVIKVRPWHHLVIFPFSAGVKLRVKSRLFKRLQPLVKLEVLILAVKCAALFPRKIYYPRKPPVPSGERSLEKTDVMVVIGQPDML